jgi:hypothetical protein
MSNKTLNIHHKNQLDNSLRETMTVYCENYMALITTLWYKIRNLECSNIWYTQQRLSFVIIYTTCFNIKSLCIVPTLLGIILRINSDYCPKQSIIIMRKQHFSSVR